VARAALSYYQDPPFTAVLGAVNSPLSSDMMHAHKEGSVGLRLSFFSFLYLFSLMSLKFMSTAPKSNCVLWFVILLILVLLILITIYFAFEQIH